MSVALFRAFPHRKEDRFLTGAARMGCRTASSRARLVCSSSSGPTGRSSPLPYGRGSYGGGFREGLAGCVLVQFGFAAGISVYQPKADAGQMQDIDRLVDDADLSTGSFRSRSNGYIYVVAF